MVRAHIARSLENHCTELSGHSMGWPGSHLSPLLVRPHLNW